VWRDRFDRNSTEHMRETAVPDDGKTSVVSERSMGSDDDDDDYSRPSPLRTAALVWLLPTRTV
jgi:hypothetical protein